MALGDKGNLCHRHRHMHLPFRHVKPDKEGKTYFEGYPEPDMIPMQFNRKSRPLKRMCH